MIFNFEHGMLPGSLELAYLGDTLYDLYVRERLVAHGGRVHALHKQAVALVCAHAQSEALGRVEAAAQRLETALAYDPMNELALYARLVIEDGNIDEFWTNLRSESKVLSNFPRLRGFHPLQASVPTSKQDALCRVVCALSCVRLFVIPWTVACQAHLSLGFPR